MIVACEHSSDLHGDREPAEAIEALGAMTLEAASLAQRLHDADEKLPPPRYPWELSTRYVDLMALYTTERSLISFVVSGPTRAICRRCRHPGPVGPCQEAACQNQEDPTKTPKVQLRDDLSPGCFLPPTVAMFPFGLGTVKSHLAKLNHRQGLINKQVSHLTWTGVNDPRTWGYEKVGSLIAAMELFGLALKNNESVLAGILDEPLARAWSYGFSASGT